MKIHKEGFVIILIAFVFCAGVGVLDYLFLLPYPILFWPLLVAAIVFFYLIVQFFRVPKRLTPLDDLTVLSPVDGKVVVIEEVEETEYFKDKRIQISIFMSPMNVHVQWNPISGINRYVKYHPGKYLVAWHPKSSTENERTTVVTEHESGLQILYRQIAGAVARRIVLYAKENETVKQGEEFGFIKFGSRVDVFLPLGTEINVGLEEKVQGKTTVLARLKTK